METTSRRFASMKRELGRGPPRASHSSPSTVAYFGAPPFFRPTRPSASRCSARRPASMVLLSSTSVIASSKGVRAISSRYIPTLSRPSISRVAVRDVATVRAVPSCGAKDLPSGLTLYSPQRRTHVRDSRCGDLPFVWNYVSAAAEVASRGQVSATSQAPRCSTSHARLKARSRQLLCRPLTPPCPADILVRG